MNKILDKFKNKKILILGFGREGQSTYHFLKRLQIPMTIGIADKQKENEVFKSLNHDLNILAHLGNDYLDHFEEYDIVIKSPGIPNKLLEIKSAKEKGVVFTSQTQIFFDSIVGKIIGITGTKGKSTTASLTHHILSNSGVNSILLGNIGKPCLDYLHKDNSSEYFVFELSSHQLSDLTKSPHIGVFLNIFPEHLDYYEDLDDYFSAKTSIARYQTKDDYFVYNSDDQKISEFASTVVSQTIPFSSKDNFLKNLKTNPLKGAHNLYNISAAIHVAQIVGISDAEIRNTIATFSPLETRLEEIATIDGVTFISDSLSTIPQSAIAGATAFPNKKIVQILGGFDRGIDYSFLGREISSIDNIVGVILIGQLAHKIETELSKNKFKGKILNLGLVSMPEIVHKAFELAKPDGIVLLSPGATSFDMFKDYKDRADQFKEAVRNLREG